MSDAISVLITGVGNCSTGEQILLALRQGRHSYRFAACNTSEEPLSVVGDATKIILPPASDPDYVAVVTAAAEDVGAQFVFPGSDAELYRLLEERAVFAARTGATLITNNAETTLRCRDKDETAQFIAEAGLSAPKSVRCSTVEEAFETVRGPLTYPVVLKPRSGSAGSTHVYIAQDDEELSFFARCVLRVGADLMVQEYVGRADQEYTVSVLHYPDGQLGGTLAIRRRLTSVLSTRATAENRTGRAELGPVLAVATGFTQGETGPFVAEVAAAAERVAEALRSTGPLNIQGRRTTSGFSVFEVNPRFSGSTGVRAALGHNAPEALIDWHLGREPVLTSSATHVRYVRGLVDYISAG